VLELKCDDRLSKLAFKFNLRRYNKDEDVGSDEVGPCGFTPSYPQVDRAWSQRLTLECDEPLANFKFALNFDLRRYNEGVESDEEEDEWGPDDLSELGGLVNMSRF